MAATVTISESNGAGETITASIANSNMGNIDAANMAALSYPITAGNNSYEKWQRITCSVAGGSSRLLNFKCWASAGLAANATHKTNLTTAVHAASAYVQPSTVNRSATYYSNVVPISVPGTANVTYGGDLAGEMDITSGLPKYTDYIITQIQTTAAAIAGTSITMNYQYDEVA